MSISVLILTLNEELNLQDCLESVIWSDDIVVFDSFSTDRTVAIARGTRAMVVQRKFSNYSAQRQAALKTVGFKHPWVLMLDADERVDEELAAELAALPADGSGLFSGYRIRRKDHFMGRWIPRSTLYPTWHLRLFQHTKAHYEPRAVHEHPVVDGEIGNLKGHLLHYSFSKGMELWLEKHRQYARLEAKEALVMLKEPVDWQGFLSRDPGRRRRALKSFSYRLPFRGASRFLYMLLWRLTFLDGWPGLVYTSMISRYEHWIQREMRALRAQK